MKKTYWYTCLSCNSMEKGTATPRLCSSCKKHGPWKKEAA